jgi:polar amino acid transport system substrate-binding protein
MTKKFFATLAACAMAILTLTGCGADKPAPQQDKAVIGVITHLNASEEKYNEVMQKLEKSYRPSKANLSAQYKYFNNLRDMQLALSAGQIDMLSTYQCVADYMIRNDDNLEILKSERILGDSFCLAVREGDTILKDDLNKAIKSMFADGTLADLSKKYITDLKGDPPAVSIENIPDAETIKVAVTGDLPPLDMILADGSPTGFSTAVLAEISKRIGKNIELISGESDARAALLTSKTADVVFWVSVPKDSTLIPTNIDKPDGIAVTEPYYNDSIVHVAPKK